MTKPTPEEKCGCMCGSGYASDCKVHNSTEARVDWEEAIELLKRARQNAIQDHQGCPKDADECYVYAIEEFLKKHAAFEKGREAR